MDRLFAVCLPKRGFMISQLCVSSFDGVIIHYNYWTISPVVYTAHSDSDDVFN
jgi:hypothetical protein